MHSFSSNILAGLFWFLFPVSLVICNDSMAYFCGLAYGRRFIRRNFLELSPNKTWEGFIGGGLCTVLFAFATPWVYRWLPFLVCPCEELSLLSFDTCATPSHHATCHHCHVSPCRVPPPSQALPHLRDARRLRP